MSGLNALRVVIFTETFWPEMGRRAPLRSLGLMLRVCKNLRQECDIVFAVTAMGADRKIQKIWAKRWLGLCYHWLTSVKADNLTLVLALKISRQHGGLVKSYKRGIELRKSATPATQKKQDDIQARRKFLLDNHSVFEAKKVELNLLLVNEGVPSGHFDAEIPLLDMPIDAALAVRMAARYMHFDADLVINRERKTELDHRLADNATLTCVAGSYYRYCITKSKAPIDNAMVRELCFRAQVRRNKGYDDIIESLVEKRGFFYAGIHDEARQLFIEWLKH